MTKARYNDNYFVQKKNVVHEQCWIIIVVCKNICGLYFFSKARGRLGSD